MLELLFATFFVAVFAFALVCAKAIFRFDSQLQETVAEVRSDADEFETFVETLKREDHANGYTLSGRFDPQAWEGLWRNTPKI
jgi:hypothetical protein